MPSSRSISPANPQQAGGSLRRLLPAPSASSSHSSLSEVNGSPTTPGSPGVAITAASGPGTARPVPARRKRGQATTAACGACRKRKSKCDGGRPRCSICRDRGTVCEFDTNAEETHTQALKRKYHELQVQKSTFEQIYNVLQSRPEQEAEEVFRRIRTGADASSILRHVNYGDVLVQLALVPEARFRYEFPYIPEMPPYLCRPDNQYLYSEVYEFALRQHSDGPQRTGHSQQRLLPDSPTDTSFVDGAGHRDPYLKPYLSAKVIHPWLDSVKPSKWTVVSKDDALMRRILHDYFLFEYDAFTFFHKDYFLEDMATGNPGFCSQLLVNAILCLGCFCHRELQGRAEFWNPRTLGYQFFAEAKRLFELEAEIERPLRFPHDQDWERKVQEWEQRMLTTIQAALLINLIHNLNGSDKIGWRYTKRAIDMGNEIQLWSGPLGSHGPEMQSVRAYTAWGLFGWQCLNSYHYLEPPLLTEAPKPPLPDPSAQPQWYGELWIKYPLTQSLVPTCHGHLFKAKADFWAIMNDFLLLRFPHHRSPTNLSLDQTFGFYNRLQAWLHNLPEPLSARKVVLPQQLKAHMHYYHMLIDLFTPILQYTGVDRIPLPKQPRDIYRDAVDHLETIVRLYYLRHGFEGFDGYLLHFLGSLNHLTMTTIEAGTDSRFLESRRSTILLLTKGIHDQGRNSFVARAILRLQVRSMRPEDVELLKRFVDIETEQMVFGPLEQTVYSNWPTYDVGLEAKAEQFKQGRTLANVLASLSLESSNSHTLPGSPTVPLQ
ncbi:hypothetical protein VTK26DRAFT_4346 [Humicola hyalothermophila]